MLRSDNVSLRLCPLYQVADALKHIDMETLETINPFTLAPWEERMQTELFLDRHPESDQLVPSRAADRDLHVHAWSGLEILGIEN
jgi:hypothetical protein